MQSSKLAEGRQRVSDKEEFTAHISLFRGGAADREKMEDEMA